MAAAGRDVTARGAYNEHANIKHEACTTSQSVRRVGYCTDAVLWSIVPLRSIDAPTPREIRRSTGNVAVDRGQATADGRPPGDDRPARTTGPAEHIDSARRLPLWDPPRLSFAISQINSAVSLCISRLQTDVVECFASFVAAPTALNNILMATQTRNENPELCHYIELLQWAVTVIQ